MCSIHRHSTSAPRAKSPATCLHPISIWMNKWVQIRARWLGRVLWGRYSTLQSLERQLRFGYLKRGGEGVAFSARDTAWTKSRRGEWAKPENPLCRGGIEDTRWGNSEAFKRWVKSLFLSFSRQWLPSEIYISGYDEWDYQSDILCWLICSWCTGWVWGWNGEEEARGQEKSGRRRLGLEQWALRPNWTEGPGIKKAVSRLKERSSMRKK